MVACSFDVEQFKPRCRLGKKRCFSRHARSLRKAQAAGNLRRDCQEELIDQIYGKRLAEDKRPSFSSRRRTANSLARIFRTAAGDGEPASPVVRTAIGDISP